MSFQAMAWAIRQKPRNSLCKLVLLLLANYADDEGMCFPSQQMLAEEAVCSLRSISYVIKHLRDGGFVATEKRWRKDVGGRVVNRYRVLAEAAKSLKRPYTQRIAPMNRPYTQSMRSIHANHARISKEEPITEPITKRDFRDFSKELAGLSARLAAGIEAPTIRATIHARPQDEPVGVSSSLLASPLLRAVR